MLAVEPRQPKIDPTFQAARQRRFLVRKHPYCPDHPETLMIVRKTVNGLQSYYCPIVGCSQSWKGKPRIEFG